MAIILPFKAWRFSDLNQSNYQKFLAPLFDVISKSEREALYDEPKNVVHVSVPKDIESAKSCWQSWKETEAIQQDSNPGFYLYEQGYEMGGKGFKRTGIVALIKIKDWADGDILRHEATMPFSVGERLELLKETELMASPTHGLYSDPDHIIDKIIAKADKKQLLSIQTDDTKEELSIIEDSETILQIQAHLAQQKVILADGHHRLQSSIELMKLNGSTHLSHNYHLMFLSKLEDPGLQILPTHRLYAKQQTFDKVDFFKKLKVHFKITELAASKTPISEHTFVLLYGSKTYELKLKDRFIGQVPWEFPKVVNRLSLTSLHYYVFEYSLGILGHSQSKNRDITYERDQQFCRDQVANNQAEFAILSPAVSVETVKKVCFSGSTLPQKSTYFFPKLISGLIFASINSEDFK